MRIAGHTGDVRWSYLTAATFGPWTLIDRELTARVVSRDEYRLGQTPLVVVLRVGRHELTYPILRLQHSDERLTVTLGERQREHEEQQSSASR